MSREVRTVESLLRSGASFVVLLVLSSACAGPGDTSKRTTPDARVLVVAPLNLAAEMEPEVEPISPILIKEMNTVFAARGNRVRTLDRGDDVWRLSALLAQRADPDTPIDFASVASTMARELGNGDSFDALLLPSLIVRTAEIKNQRGRWDGTSQEIEYRARGLRSRKRAAEIPLEGDVPGASLHLASYAPDGTLIRETIGGLALLIRVQVIPAVDETSGPTIELVPHEDPFGDRDRLRTRVSEIVSEVLD